MKFKFVAPCLMGIESLLRDELIALGAKNVEATNGRVFFEGDERTMVRTNICLRYAERVLIEMGNSKALSFEELFNFTASLPWESIIPIDGAFPVKGRSVNSKLSSVPACQSIIKKAIVKRMKSRYEVPWFKETAELYQVQFLLMKDTVSLMLETSGVGLHKRGYRTNSNIAPIKETLAAAIVKFAGVNRHSTLIDPFCGSGTLLIEGAMLAMNMAPGINRSFAAEKWRRVDKSFWQQERKAAERNINYDVDFRALGTDIDERAVCLTLENSKRAGVEMKIEARQEDFKHFSLNEQRATVVCNPPYGERLMDEQQARDLYKMMGKKFDRRSGYSYYIISPDEYFEKCFGVRADKRRKLYNGMIKCQLFMYFK